MNLQPTIRLFLTLILFMNGQCFAQQQKLVASDGLAEDQFI